jgi:hypothetical protein
VRNTDWFRIDQDGTQNRCCVNTHEPYYLVLKKECGPWNILKNQVTQIAFHKRSDFQSESRDSSVGIATGYGLDDRGVGVRVPVGSEYSLLHIVQTGSGAHPASYPMGTGGSFPDGKAAGA